MYYLLLAVITSVLVVIVIKFFDKYNIDSFQAIGINYIICIIAGILSHKGRVDVLSMPSQPWFYFALLLGGGFILMFNVFAIATSKIGIALSSVSSKMSVVIPVYFGIILYNDSFDIFKVIGVVFAILAFYFIFKKEKNIPFRKLYFFLPLMLFMGNGFNDTMQTYCQRMFHMDNNMILSFMIVIYSSAFTLSLLIFTVRKLINNYSISLKNIIAGVVLGVFNFTTTFFFLKSVGAFQSTFVFPVFNVSLVLMSTLIGVIFFREKLRFVNWAGIILAIAAILIIAIG